jgi:hypothetical protein
MKTTRQRRFGAAKAATVLAVLTLAAAGPSGAGTSANFSDALGDSRGAPDILSVSVENDAKGEITVRVLTFLGNLAPPSDAQLTLVLDTDRDESTGSDGFDYAFQYDARFNEHAVGRWDGRQFTVFEAPTAAITWTAISARFTINRSDLGGTNGFDFYLRSTTGGPESDQLDDAPNEGTWSYTLAAAPEIVRAVYPSTLRARPGKILDARGVRVRLSDGTTVRPETLTCRLTAGRTVLKPLRGGCRWRIAKTLKGRTVVLMIVARHGGEELRATRRLVVR